MDKKRINTLRKLFECKDTSKERVVVKKKKLKESYGVDVIEDLVDRVKANYDGDLEEAVRQAIDDGLIYTEDIFALMDYLGGASDVSDLFFQKYYDALFNELYNTAKERLGVDESLKEEKSLPLKDAKFLSKIRKIANNAFKKFDKDDAKALEEIERMHKDGEITDEEHEYIVNYYDTLVDDHYPETDKWTHRTMDDVVWEEIFSGSDAHDMLVPFEGGERISSDYYFDPGDRKEFGDGFGIGIRGSKNFDRPRKVAKALGLKTMISKDKERLIVIVPGEFETITKRQYEKKNK